MQHRSGIATFLSFATLLPSLGAQTTIFSNVASSPTSDVPGYPGLKFTSGTSTVTFVRPFGSPNGNWILTADTDTGSTTDDEVLIVNGVVVLKEGDPAPWDVASMLGPFDTRVDVNDAGEYVFSNNTTAAANDDYVVKVTAGPTFNVVAQEGSPMASIASASYDDTLDSAFLAGANVGLQADGVDGGGITTSDDEVFEIGPMVIAREAITQPGGQFTATVEFDDNIDFEEMWSDATGTNVLYQGDLTGSTSTDDVVVVNGNVVIQEGFVIPGSGFADPIDSSGILGATMDAGGNWYARGNNATTELDWLLRNGVVVASVGAPVTPGATELWSDTDFAACFFAHTGNGTGDFITAGVTDNDSRYNGIIVWNGVQVVCREGDPVDVDNDGMFDDGLYINTFGDDDFYLSDANELYFTVTLRDVTATTVATAFLRKDIAPCPGGTIRKYGTGCAGSTGSAPELSVLGCATPGGSVTLAITDGLPNSTALVFLGAVEVALPIGGTGCTLLVNTPPLVIGVPLDGAGSLTAPTVIPANTPSVSAFVQVFNADAGAPAGFTTSNGVEIPIQ